LSRWGITFVIWHPLLWWVIHYSGSIRNWDWWWWPRIHDIIRIPFIWWFKPIICSMLNSGRVNCSCYDQDH
jgi:hypothetical protein